MRLAVSLWAITVCCNLQLTTCNLTIVTELLSLLVLLTLPPSSGEHLCNGIVSVRPSVCPVNQQPVNGSDVHLASYSSIAGGKYRSTAGGAAYRLLIESRAGSVML